MPHKPSQYLKLRGRDPELFLALQEIVNSLPNLDSSFRAYRSKSLSFAGTSNLIIPCDTVDWDVSKEFDTVSGGLVTKRAGIYLLSTGVAISTGLNDGSTPRLMIFKNGALERYLYFNALGALVGPNLNGCDLFYLKQGELVQPAITVINAPTIVTGSANTWFSGMLLRAV